MPALIERVERTNAVMVDAPPRRDSYMMEVDRGRNCYACGGFGHIAHHCKPRKRKGSRQEKIGVWGERFKGNYKYLNNLKEEENLEFLN